MVSRFFGFQLPIFQQGRILKTLQSLLLIDSIRTSDFGLYRDCIYRNYCKRLPIYTPNVIDEKTSPAVFFHRRFSQIKIMYKTFFILLVLFVVLARATPAVEDISDTSARNESHDHSHCICRCLASKRAAIKKCKKHRHHCKFSKCRRGHHKTGWWCCKHK